MLLDTENLGSIITREFDRTRQLSEAVISGGSSTSSVPSPPSPVTWHIVLWVLIALAINSMAQPSGRICGAPSRNRIYLASSPIICVADSVDLIVQAVVSKYYLRITPLNAYRLVALARSDRLTLDQGTTTSSSVVEAQSYTWPRLIFFVMGTLPAAIKLASFGGAPWTKAWGMMFMASFIVTELATVLARSGKGDVSRYQEDVLCYQLDRTKIARLSSRMRLFDRLLFFLAYITHIGLLVWAIEGLWVLFLEASKTTDDIHNFIIWPKLALTLPAPLFTLIHIAPAIISCFVSLPKRRSTVRILPPLYKILIFAVTFPDYRPVQQGITPAYTTVDRWTYILYRVYIYVLLGAFYYTLYWGLHYVSKRWPIFTKVLLLDLSTEARQLEEVTRDPNTPAEEESSRIDEAAWFFFCFFLTNFGVFILWYAYIYNSEGTVNPSWTDVFG